jgi:hypothetical protein
LSLSCVSLARLSMIGLEKDGKIDPESKLVSTRVFC